LRARASLRLSRMRPAGFARALRFPAKMCATVGCQGTGAESGVGRFRGSRGIDGRPRINFTAELR